MRWMTFVLVGTCAFAGTSCAPASPVTAADAPGHYPITGTVVAQPSASSITLAHDAVAHYMPAMVMDFHADGLPVLRSGERVRGTLVVTGEQSRLTDIVVVPTTASYTAPTATIAGGPAPLGSIVPDVDLRTQSGTAVRMSDYRGRVMLVTFIYTRCPLPDFCPRLMRNFADVRRALEGRARGGRSVRPLAPSHRAFRRSSSTG
jgi:protein SCO1